MFVILETRTSQQPTYMNHCQWMLRQLTRLATSFKSFQLNQVGRNSARLSLLVHHGACIEIVVNVPDLFHLVYAPGNPL